MGKKRYCIIIIDYDDDKQEVDERKHSAKRNKKDEELCTAFPPRETAADFATRLLIARSEQL